MPITDPKARALAKVKAQAVLVQDARKGQADLLEQRTRFIAQAQDDGATYPEIAEASGLSPDRVKQILSTVRRNSTTKE